MADEKNGSNYDQQIDENLKRVYQEIIEEQVPDRFQDLLNQLRAQDNQRSGTGAGEVE